VRFACQLTLDVYRRMNEPVEEKFGGQLDTQHMPRSSSSACAAAI